MPAPRTDAQPEVDTARFRQVLGHFCTGVTVITAPGPAGFACQAFAALSLDPPLVLFCPGRPLLFYRGRYAATDPGAGNQHGPAEVVDTLLAWPRYADWM